MSELVHILHVEDDALDATLLAKSFSKERRASEQLHQVRSAEAALAFLERREEYTNAPEVGLVLLDLSLPKMSGLELLRELKARPQTRGIPVVVLTGSSNPADLRASYLEHANAVLRKPESIDALVDLVNALDAFWIRLVTLTPAVTGEPQ